VAKQLGRDYVHGFAIVRIDDWGEHERRPPALTRDRVTVVKVLASEDAAEAEVERLNRLADEAGRSDTTAYFWQTTRIFAAADSDRRDRPNG
jgi:hypothetical protein